MKVDGSNAPVKAQNKAMTAAPQKTLKEWIMSQIGQISNALPGNITPERMARMALTAITKDEKLAKCTPASFMGALYTSAQLGLEPNTPLGQAYLIPFWNGKKNCYDVQFQVGYQGLLDMCYRTGKYKTIQARVVYEGDDFDYSFGFSETLIHRPREKTSKPVYVYAYYELTNGARSFEVMTWQSVMNYAKKYSQSANSKMSPWSLDPEAMAKKTLLKKVLKFAPKAVEVADAVTNDSAVISATVSRDGNEAFIQTDVIDAEILAGNALNGQANEQVVENAEDEKSQVQNAEPNADAKNADEQKSAVQNVDNETPLF